MTSLPVVFLFCLEIFSTSEILQNLGFLHQNLRVDSYISCRVNDRDSGQKVVTEEHLLVILCCFVETKVF